jgi:hypothetical protein
MERKKFAPANFRKENAPPNSACEPDPIGIAAILQRGYSNNQGTGWTAKDLLVHSTSRKKSDAFIGLLREDAKELQGVLSVVSNKYDTVGWNGQFKKRKSSYTAVSIKYLVEAWGVGKNFPAALLKQQVAGKRTREQPMESSMHEYYLPVIDSYFSAKVRYTPRNLFIQQRIRDRTEEEEVVAYNNLKRQQAYIYREEAKGDWILLTAEEQAFWEFEARSKLEYEPYIRDRIIELLCANPSKSFDKVVEDIGHWCSAASIKRWIASKSGYHMYTQRTLPLLTSAQKERHVKKEKASMVWLQMGPPEIARGFILAFRIAQKVINNKGDNAFPQSRDFHSSVRSDFYDMSTGVRKCANVVE